MRDVVGSPKAIETCGLRITEDIKTLKYPLFNLIINLFEKYDKNGILPFSGGLAEQPAHIIEIFETLTVLQSEYQQAIQEEQEIKRKRKDVRHRY